MLKKTARVIVTFECNRNCPGCCNKKLPEYKVIHNINELLAYQEIVITGGEPMLIPGKVMDLVDGLRTDCDYRGKIYMYTSLWNGKKISKDILRELDGITYTLHAESTDKEIMELKALSNSGILQNPSFVSRLFIDTRVYERYDLSNINFARWSVIRKLVWKEKCEPAQNEDLLVYKL